MPDENSDLFDQYSGHYTETVNSAINFSGLKVDFFTKVKSQYIRRLAHQLHKPLDTLDVLDVGCGVGNFEVLLQSVFGSVKGVDVSSQSIEHAKTMALDASFYLYDGQNLPFADQSVDLAFTVCVLHHVMPEKRNAILAEVRRVLRPGGMMQIFEHNPRNPMTMRVVNSCPFDADAQLLTAKEAVSYLEEANFQNSKSASILTIPPFFDWMYSLDKLAAPIGLGAQYYAYGFS